MFKRHRSAGTLIILLITTVSVLTAVGGRPEASTVAITFLLAANAVVTLKVWRRQTEVVQVERILQQSLERLEQSVVDQSRSHSQALESLQDDFVAGRRIDGDRHARTRKHMRQVQESLEDVQRQLQHGRKLAGERHARTRELLADSKKTGLAIRDRLDGIESRNEIGERRILGILESERLQGQDRYERLMERFSQAAPRISAREP